MGKATCPMKFRGILPFRYEAEAGQVVAKEIPEGDNLRLCADLTAGEIKAILVVGDTGTVKKMPLSKSVLWSDIADISEPEQTKAAPPKPPTPPKQAAQVGQDKQPGVPLVVSAEYLAGMNNMQLKKHAKDNSIALNGARTNPELIATILAAQVVQEPEVTEPQE